jgi:copper oxidase (laccase) domain-containing protein
MIRAPGLRGAAFGTRRDGNGRDDAEARRRISAELRLPTAWAAVHQVHGPAVAVVESPGSGGEADGLVTAVPMLPLTVAHTDCLAVVVEGDGGVGIAHAGWRGVAAGIVAALRAALDGIGVAPLRAAVGPGIGPCCFEVGADVSGLFPGFESRTTWGTTSVDLPAAAAADLDGLEVWRSDRCSHCRPEFHSFREDGRMDPRQVGVAWLP